jgi:hypothetical protein
VGRPGQITMTRERALSAGIRIGAYSSDGGRWEQWICANPHCRWDIMALMPPGGTAYAVTVHEVVCDHMKFQHWKACEGHACEAPSPLPEGFKCLGPAACAEGHAEPETAVLAVLRGKGRTTLSCPRCLASNVWLFDGATSLTRGS